jgi:hypothetical protein
MVRSFDKHDVMWCVGLDRDQHRGVPFHSRRVL